MPIYVYLIVILQPVCVLMCVYLFAINVCMLGWLCTRFFHVPASYVRRWTAMRGRISERVSVCTPYTAAFNGGKFQRRSESPKLVQREALFSLHVNKVCIFVVGYFSREGEYDYYILMNEVFLNIFLLFCPFIITAVERSKFSAS